MNVGSFLENNGIVIPNPNYNPKKKKNNGQPPTLLTTDVNKDMTGGSALASSIYDNYRKSWIMGDTSMYRKYGVTPNQISNMDKERWEAQSAFAKLGNSAVQAVLSEGGLGTLIGASDIVDTVANAIMGWDQNDYQNPVSNYLQGIQNKFRNEWNPIYTDPNVNIFNGGLLSVGWYAQNIPSIMSSLALLLPSQGIVSGAKWALKGIHAGQGVRKSVAWLSKGFKEGSKMRTAMNTDINIARANRFLEILPTAALSRTMENYQEARGVYQDMYGEAYGTLKNMSDDEYQNYIDANKETFKDVDIADKQAVAKAIAKKSADQDFQANFINTASDVIELYALRDAFGRRRLEETARKSARKADRLSRMFPLMDETAAKEAYKKLPLWQRTKYWMGDQLVGSKLAIAAQLNEGFEEGVNYIAQQEAMDTGRIILGTKEATPWDDRYIDYFTNPQLYESAFWGVMGGVVFQAGGSKIQRIKSTIKDKRSDKKNYRTEETGEEKPDNGIFNLVDLPEVERMKANINSRTEKSLELKNKLDAIYNQGVNPYNLEEKVNTQEEKDAMATLVKSQYVSDLTIQAINNGTFDMTRSWMADDKVKQAFADKGIVKAEDANAWQKAMLDKMDKVAKSYDDNIAKMNIFSAESKITMPVEFLQIAATHNVMNEVNNEALEGEKQSFLAKFNEQKEKALADGSLDEDPFYETALKIQTQVNGLYALYAQRREIEDNLKKEKTLSMQLALDNINKVIKREQKVLGNNSDFAVEDVLFSLGNVWSENKKNSDIDADMQKVIEDTVNTGDFKSLEQFLGLDEGHYGKLESEEDIKEFKKKYLDRNETYKKAMQKIDALGKEEGSMKANYISALLVDSMIRQNNANKISNIEDFERFMGAQNNTMMEARVNAINESYKNLSELFKNHRDNEDEFRQWIKNAIEGKSNQDLNFLNDTEKANLDKSMKVLNLTDLRNKTLGQTLSLMFDASMVEDENVEKEDEEEEKKIEESENTFNQQNSNEQKPQNPIVQKSNGQTEQKPSETNVDKSLTDAEKKEREIEEENIKNAKKYKYIREHLSDEEKQTIDIIKNKSWVDDDGNATMSVIIEPQKGNRPPKIIFTEIGSPDSFTISPNVTYLKSNGEIDHEENGNDDECNIEARNTNFPIDILQNHYLFDVQDDVDLLSDDWYIAIGPSIAYNEYSGLLDFEKGLVCRKSSSPVGEGMGRQLSTQQPDNQTQDPETQQQGPTPLQPLTLFGPTSQGNQKQGNQKQGKGNNTPPSSTGELNISNPKDEDNVYQIYNFIESKFDPEGNLDDLREKAIKYAATVTDKNAEKIIDDYITAIKERAEKDKNKSPEEKAAEEMLLKLMAGEQTQDDNFAMTARGIESMPNKINFFAKPIDQFTAYYAESRLLPILDGKRVINIRDLISIATAPYANRKYLAEAIIKNMQDFFSSKLGKALYVIEDPEHLIDTSFLNDLDKTEKELKEDKTPFAQHKDGVSVERINISDVIKSRLINSTLSDNNDYWDLMNNLQKGDKLKMRTTDYEILFFGEKNGKEILIGTLPKPKLGEDNGYHLVQKGWKYDVYSDKKGSFEQFITNLMQNSLTDPDARGLWSTVLEYRLAKKYRKEADAKKAIERFKKNKYIIREAKNDNTGLLFYYKDIKNFDYENALDHLGNLYYYTRMSNLKTINANEELKQRIESIPGWFKTLFNENDEIGKWTNESDVTVDYITDGDLNRITDKPSEETDKLKPWNEAIGAQTDAHLAVTNYGGREVIISGQKSFALNNGVMQGGGVTVAVFGRNTTPSFASARTIGFSAKRDGERGKRLRDAIRKYLYDYLFNINENQESRFNSIIGSIFNFYGNEVSALFASGQNFTNYKKTLSSGRTLYSLIIKKPKFANGVDIQYTFIFNNDGTFHSYKQDYYDSNKKSQFKNNYINVTNNRSESEKQLAVRNIVNSFSSIISEDDYWYYNITPNTIKRDNVGANLSNFFVRENGKLKLKIGEYFEEEYDSFEDYIIKNNLLRINTYQNEDGSNFNFRGYGNSGNQILKVAVSTNKNSNSEANRQNLTQSTKDEKVIYKNADKEKFEEYKQTITSNSNENTGAALVRQMLGDELYDATGKKLKEDSDINLDDLFPHSILYDGKKNVVVNGELVGSIAETATRGNTYWTRYRDDGTFASSGRRLRKGRVVIGNLLLNMMSSKNTYLHQVAFRKLIHEQIHITLHNEENKSKYNSLMSQLNEIYNEFRKQLYDDQQKVKSELKDLNKNKESNSEKIQTLEEKLKTLQNLTTTTNYNKLETRLEEFLVESMTNNDFFDYLNDKHSILKRKEFGKKTLLEKIVDFIAKLCGWNIKNDSLYKDVLQVINQAYNGISPKKITKTAKTRTDNSIKKKEEAENKLKKKQEKKPVLVESNNDVADETQNADLTNEIYGKDIIQENSNFKGTEGIDQPYTESDFDFEDDFGDDALNLESVNNKRTFSSSINRISSLQTIRSILPQEAAVDFDKLVNDGSFKMVCSI